MAITTETATVAAGCFWGVEHIYRRHFGNGKSLIDVEVGYTGGDKENPTYREVCGKQTGHVEALKITFDPSLVTYRTLLEFFYRMHDPTTLNSQGPDHGPQYRSAIFFHTPDQEAIAHAVTKAVQEQWFADKKVQTLVMPAGKWWSAEEYHQKYLGKNPDGYECPSHFVRKFPDLKH